MFSRAKRFSYPKPEAPTPECDRCLKKHHSFRSSSKSLRHHKSEQTITPNTARFARRCNTISKMDTTKITPMAEILKRTPKSRIPIRIPGSLPTTDTSKLPVFSTPRVGTFKVKKATVLSPKSAIIEKTSTLKKSAINRQEELKQIVQRIDHHRQKVNTLRRKFIQSASEPSSDEGVTSGPSSTSTVPSTTTSPTESDVEEKPPHLIENHLENLGRRSIRENKSLVIVHNKSPKDLHQVRTTGPCSTTEESDVEETVKNKLENHLKDISRLCARETRDLVTMYNRTQEELGQVRPDEYSKLVEACAELIEEVKKRLPEPQPNNKNWKKVKNIIKITTWPIRKIVRTLNHDP